jgi:hypothetical protein
MNREEIKEGLLIDINNNNLDLNNYEIFELVESYLPVYNNEIIKEWQEMPSEYDDQGGNEYGRGEDSTILNLMLLDLNVYYYHTILNIIGEIEEELEAVK